MKPNDELSPAEVITMPLSEFEERFGFRPVDALEKRFFAVTGKRPDAMQREMIEAGLMGEADLSKVVMV